MLHPLRSRPIPCFAHVHRLSRVVRSAKDRTTGPQESLNRGWGGRACIVTHRSGLPSPFFFFNPTVGANIKTPPHHHPPRHGGLPPPPFFFKGWSRNVALHNMLCLLPGPPANSLLPSLLSGEMECHGLQSYISSIRRVVFFRFVFARKDD